MEKLVKLIGKWVEDRNLHTADPRKQINKLQEEVNELKEGVLSDNEAEIIDGIGDVTVVLICLSKQLGLEYKDCVLSAYNEIKDRKGKLINGIFVKEEDL